MLQGAGARSQRQQTGRADEALAFPRREGGDSVGQLLDHLLDRGRAQPPDHGHVLDSLPHELAQSIRLGGLEPDDPDPRRRLTRPLVVAERSHQLDLAIDLAKAVPGRECHRGHVLCADPRAQHLVPEAPGMLGAGTQEQRPDALAPRLGEHARKRERPPRDRGARGDGAADDVPVPQREQVPPVRVVPERATEIHDPDRQVGLDRVLHAHPGLELGVAESLDDHPDLFSLPCFFAYTSPRLKIASPSGMQTTPITSSGHTSAHMTPRPSRIEPRIPRSA